MQNLFFFCSTDGLKIYQVIQRFPIKPLFYLVFIVSGFYSISQSGVSKLMHAFSSKGGAQVPLGFAKGGGGGALNFHGGGGGGKKIRNRAAAVTGPQRHLTALGLGESSFYNSPRHAAGKSFEINQLAYH